MQTNALIDDDTARQAQDALLVAITALLEQALETCTRTDAPGHMAHVIDLCGNVTMLGSALAVIRARRAP